MSGLTLLAVAGIAGLLSAWMTVLLLVAAPRIRVGQRVFRLKGPVAAAASHLSAFTVNHLLAGLPAPSRLFEQLGPDRFRREFMRNLRSRADSHVDEVMGRRTGKAWEGLSAYARNRVYSHVHRRLPFAVDDFVDHLQRELDEIVVPGALVRRWFVTQPSIPGELFLEAFGRDLRTRLPIAALLAMPVGGIAAWLAPASWAFPAVAGGAAAAGSVATLAMLMLPRRAVDVWPFGFEGILHRHRQRYLRALARRLSEEPLAWEAVSSDLREGPHSGRMRIVVRREMSGILDTTVFKATLQLLLGPEAMVAVKQSAIEKAMELMESTPASPGLRESYRLEVERSLMHAAGQVEADVYGRLWKQSLLPAWQWVPVVALAIGVAGGILAGWLVGLS